MSLLGPQEAAGLLDYLARLSRLSTQRRPTPADVIEACAVMREAMGAEDAYVVCAGDPYFTKIGDESDPRAYEIKQRGYWLVWRQLAADDAVFAAVFTVVEKLVTAGSTLDGNASGSHIACILPADESNSEVLVLRGPWHAGVGADKAAFLEAARPVLASLTSRVLDAKRQLRQQEQLRALADVARAFSEASAVDNVLSAVCTALAKASGFDWVQAFVVNESCTWIHDRATNITRHSETETAAQGLVGNKRWLNIASELNRRRKPWLRPDVFAEDVGEKPEILAYFQRAHILSQAMLPMIFQDTMLGFVVFSSSFRCEFDAARLAFLSDLVSQAATTIKGLRLYQELEEASRIEHFLARTDALTGIPNRRYIEEVLRAECARAQRYSEPVSVVMADLDYFKLVNDTHGHDAGDAALKHVAGIARDTCRESDFVGRWGGDEFMFILPVTPLDGGLAFAERFRSSLCDSIFVPPGAGDPWRICLSAGVAEASTAQYPRPDSLFNMADAALYQAKEAGRNRVLAADLRAAAA